MGNQAMVIEDDAVHLWRIELEHVTPRLDWLDHDERHRAGRFKVAGKADQLIRSHTALRAILGRSLEVAPASVVWATGKHGKPRLADEALQFNLSHSGDMAVVGVLGRGRIGVDVERFSQRPHDDIARRFFSPREVAEYESFGSEQRRRAFYRGWTRKEAYLKAWGTGLQFPSRRFTVSLKAGAGRLLKETEMPGDEEEGRWCFYDRALGRYHLAACWQGQRRVVEHVFHQENDEAGVAWGRQGCSSQ